MARPLELPIVAIAVLLLVHVPPVITPSLRLVPRPLHTDNVPKILGNELTIVYGSILIQSKLSQF